MIDYNGLEKVVVLFDHDASNVVAQIRFAEFEDCLKRKAPVENFAATTVRAGYAIVGSGLAVRGIVLFLFDVDEEGRINPNFNIPLDYLMQNAGAGPDLGNGPIHYASRAQCPVPWHASNLWESSEENEGHPTSVLQRSIWRNRIGLKPAADIPCAIREFDDLDCAERTEFMQQQLTSALGEEGRVSVQNLVMQHKKQFALAKKKFRSEMEKQQQNYLERMRELRDEIQRLKAAVRTEQESNRALQEMMRRP
ncbi:MAG: hypothetical protein O3A63_12855 [Proteobacteria bacterium]|nr:hypothetical protein [Pseudomonadota bacterium]